MRDISSVASKISNKPVTVLITGESGTGKEVLARYLHAHSDRSGAPNLEPRDSIVCCCLARAPIF